MTVNIRYTIANDNGTFTIVVATFKTLWYDKVITANKLAGYTLSGKGYMHKLNARYLHKIIISADELLDPTQFSHIEKIWRSWKLELDTGGGYVEVILEDNDELSINYLDEDISDLKEIQLNLFEANPMAN